MTIQAPSRPPRTRQILTWDLEWYPSTFKLRLAGLYDGETYQSFTTIADFLDAITARKYAGAFCYAHAGGRFDTTFLLQELLRKRDWRIKGAFAGSSIIKLKIQKPGHTRSWLLLDSYRTFPASLAAIGKSVGIPKLDDYECPNYPDCGHKEKCIFDAPIGVLRDYNEQDCLILHRALERLQSTLLDLGSELCATAGASAVMLFRRRYLRSPIPTYRALNRIAREAYVGSRVEVFRPRAATAVNWYDINSSFPWSMTQPIPGELMGTSKRWNESELGLIRAKVRVPDMYVPPLPYRSRDERIYHPTGSWSGWFTGVDLLALQRLGGTVEKVSRVHYFAGRDDTRDYAQAMFDLRCKVKKTDPFLSLVYKLLGNSLYGKFVERADKQEMIRLRRGETPPDDAEPVLGCPGVFLVDVHRPAPHEHVAIGATITARSRQFLGHVLRQCEKDGARIWYCDTDSVVTDGARIVGDGLGSLKHEHVSREARFAAAKTYFRQCADECPCGAPESVVAKMKGVSRATLGDYELFTGGKGVMRKRQASPKEMLREGLLEPYEIDVEKVMRGAARPKRKLLGSDSRPWSVKEIGERWRG